MKKIFFLASAISIMVTQTGCFGSFTLVKKVYEFNQGASSDKIVQTLLFYALNIVPVYGVASVVDIFVLNLIEFWTGSNPIAMSEGATEEQLLTIKGETFKVTATKNKLTFEKLEEGVLVDMGAAIFSDDNQSWSFQKDDLTQELLRINPDQTVDYNTLAGFQTFSVLSNTILLANTSTADHSRN